MNAAQPDATVEDAGSFPRGGTEEQMWEFLLRYAVLAPSGHNTQPWRRHTHRATFETRPIPHQLLAQLGRDTRRAGATPRRTVADVLTDPPTGAGASS